MLESHHICVNRIHLSRKCNNKTINFNENINYIAYSIQHHKNRDYNIQDELFDMNVFMRNKSVSYYM